MSQHLPDYILTSDWVDITTLPNYSPIVSALCTIQAKYVNRAYVWFGGSTEPEGDQGSLLLTGLAISGTTDHIWTKGDGTLSILKEG